MHGCQITAAHSYPEAAGSSPSISLSAGTPLLVDRVDALRAAMEKTRARYPFVIDAVVVLPDHIHAVWTLPPGDADFSIRWRLIKSWFARSIPKERAIKPRAAGARGARHLAAPILGAPDQRRRGLRASRRVLLHQSRQAQACSLCRATGRTRRFIGMCVRVFSPKTGRGTSNCWESSESAFEMADYAW